MRPRRLELVGLALLAATALTWALGESGLLLRNPGGGQGWAPWLVLALALAKGTGVALDFMELREAPPLWRRLVLGWLVVVIGLVALLRWV